MKMSKLRFLLPFALIWSFQETEVKLVEETATFEDSDGFYTKKTYTLTINLTNFNIISHRFLRYIFLNEVV